MHEESVLLKKRKYIREYMRKYLSSHLEYKEKQKIRDRQRYLQHRKEILARQAEYDYQNREKILLTKKLYMQTEKGKLSNKKKVTKYKNREKELLNNLTCDQWLDVLQSQNHCCGLCERNFNEYGLKIHCDHIYPVSKTQKGDNGLTLDNVQALCDQCNTTKGSKVYTVESYLELKKKCIAKYNMEENNIILNERVKRILENERRK